MSRSAGPCWTARGPVVASSRRPAKVSARWLSLICWLTDTAGATEPGAVTATPRGPDFAPRAKRCIFLFMVGGPSQMELFDPKPALDKLHGQKLPPSFGKVTSQFVENDPICLGSTRQVGPLRPIGHGHVRSDSAHAPARRSHRPGPLVRGGQRHPRPGPLPDELRPDVYGVSEPGQLAHLRLGQRVAEPSRFRGHGPASGHTRKAVRLVGVRASSPPLTRERCFGPEPNRS